MEDTSPFVGPLIPVWTSALDFKARVDFLTCVLHGLCATDSLELPPV